MVGEAERAAQFEAIGLQQRLFTKDQLARAAADARRSGDDLGALLVAQGVLSAAQRQGLERAVTYRLGRDEDKAIAKIIVESNYCDAAAVDRAMSRQKELYQRTGELIRLSALLLETRDLTESQRTAAHKILTFERRRS